MSLTIKELMELKIKKALYCGVVIITAILLSTLTVHASTFASALPWTDSGSSFTGDLTTYTFTDFMLLHKSANTSSYLHSLITTFLHQIEPNSSPEGNSTRYNISRGKFSSVPDPLTLLLLGTVLMGIALYRRLRNK